MQGKTFHRPAGKRIVSVLLAFMMLAGMFTGLGMTANAAEREVPNWGEFQSALANVDYDVIRLVGADDFSGPAFTISSGRDVTIDLNGHNLTAWADASVDTAAVTVDGGALTVTGSGSLYARGDAVDYGVQVINDGALTVTGAAAVNATGDLFGVFVDNSRLVTDNGSLLYANGTLVTGVDCNDVSVVGDSVFNIWVANGAGGPGLDIVLDDVYIKAGVVKDGITPDFSVTPAALANDPNLDVRIRYYTEDNWNSTIQALFSAGNPLPAGTGGGSVPFYGQKVVGGVVSALGGAELSAYPTDAGKYYAVARFNAPTAMSDQTVVPTSWIAVKSFVIVDLEIILQDEYTEGDIIKPDFTVGPDALKNDQSLEMRIRYYTEDNWNSTIKALFEAGSPLPWATSLQFRGQQVLGTGAGRTITPLADIGSDCEGEYPTAPGTYYAVARFFAPGYMSDQTAVPTTWIAVKEFAILEDEETGEPEDPDPEDPDPEKNQPALTLYADVSVVNKGGAVELTAVLEGAVAGATGTDEGRVIHFYADEADLYDLSKRLGTAITDSFGFAKFEVEWSDLPNGYYDFVAVAFPAEPGAPNNLEARGVSEPVFFRGGPELVLTASAPSIFVGESVVLTATLNGAFGVAGDVGRKIHFYYGATKVGEADTNGFGEATLTLTCSSLHNIALGLLQPDSYDFVAYAFPGGGAPLNGEAESNIVSVGFLTDWPDNPRPDPDAAISLAVASVQYGTPVTPVVTTVPVDIGDCDDVDYRIRYYEKDEWQKVIDMVGTVDAQLAAGNFWGHDNKDANLNGGAKYLGNRPTEPGEYYAVIRLMAHDGADCCLSYDRIEFDLGSPAKFYITKIELELEPEYTEGDFIVPTVTVQPGAVALCDGLDYRIRYYEETEWQKVVGTVGTVEERLAAGNFWGHNNNDDDLNGAPLKYLGNRPSAPGKYYAIIRLYQSDASNCECADGCVPYGRIEFDLDNPVEFVINEAEEPEPDRPDPTVSVDVTSVAVGTPLNPVVTVTPDAVAECAGLDYRVRYYEKSQWDLVMDARADGKTKPQTLQAGEFYMHSVDTSVITPGTEGNAKHIKTAPLPTEPGEYYSVVRLMAHTDATGCGDYDEIDFDLDNPVKFYIVSIDLKLDAEYTEGDAIDPDVTVLPDAVANCDRLEYRVRYYEKSQWEQVVASGNLQDGFFYLSDKDGNRPADSMGNAKILGAVPTDPGEYFAIVRLWASDDPAATGTCACADGCVYYPRIDYDLDNPVEFVINPAEEPLVLTLEVDPAKGSAAYPPNVNGTVTLTATVTGGNAALVGDTIAFIINGVFNNVDVTHNGDGTHTATLDLVNPAAGDYTFNAAFRYDGTPVIGDDDVKITDYIVKAVPTLVLTADPASGATDQDAVVLTATINDGYFPTGEITFAIGFNGSPLGTATVTVEYDSSTGEYTASWPMSHLPAGTYRFGARYHGDDYNEMADDHIFEYVVTEREPELEIVLSSIYTKKEVLKYGITPGVVTTPADWATDTDLDVRVRYYTEDDFNDTIAGLLATNAALPNVNAVGFSGQQITFNGSNLVVMSLKDAGVGPNVADAYPTEPGNYVAVAKYFGPGGETYWIADPVAFTIIDLEILLDSDYSESFVANSGILPGVNTYPAGWGDGNLDVRIRYYTEDDFINTIEPLFDSCTTTLPNWVDLGFAGQQVYDTGDGREVRSLKDAGYPNVADAYPTAPGNYYAVARYALPTGTIWLASRFFAILEDEQPEKYDASITLEADRDPADYTEGETVILTATLTGVMYDFGEGAYQDNRGSKISLYYGDGTLVAEGNTPDTIDPWNGPGIVTFAFDGGILPLLPEGSYTFYAVYGGNTLTNPASSALPFGPDSEHEELLLVTVNGECDGKDCQKHHKHHNNHRPTTTTTTTTTTTHKTKPTKPTNTTNTTNTTTTTTTTTSKHHNTTATTSRTQHTTTTTTKAGGGYIPPSTPSSPENVESGFTRFDGVDRIDTAIKASGEWTSANTVVLAYSKNFPDAQAGGPLAAAANAPILLTAGGALETSVANRINQLGASKVYILGGPAVISKAVEDALIAGGKTVVRLGGADRYETATIIAVELSALCGNKKFDSAFIASGDNFADALAVAPVAALQRVPILFVPSGGVSNVTKNYLSQAGISKVTVLGGTLAVGAAVETHLQGVATVERVFGENRYETAVAIYNKYSSVFTGNAIILACGDKFADALTGTALAAKLASPLMLINPDITNINANVRNIVKASAGSGKKVFVMGGVAALSDAVVNAYIK